MEDPGDKGGRNDDSPDPPTCQVGKESFEISLRLVHTSFKYSSVAPQLFDVSKRTVWWSVKFFNHPIQRDTPYRNCSAVTSNPFWPQNAKQTCTLVERNRPAWHRSIYTNHLLYIADFPWFCFATAAGCFQGLISRPESHVLGLVAVYTSWWDATAVLLSAKNLGVWEQGVTTLRVVNTFAPFSSTLCLNVRPTTVAVAIFLYLFVAHQAFSTATRWLFIPRQVATVSCTSFSFRYVYAVGACATGSPALHNVAWIASFTAANRLFPLFFYVSTLANSAFFGCLSFECGCPAPSATTWHLGTFQAFRTAPFRLLPQGNELTEARLSSRVSTWKLVGTNFWHKVGRRTFPNLRSGKLQVPETFGPEELAT